MSFDSIPVVDIADLGSPDPAAHAAVIRRLRDAAEQVGFLYVTGHGIPGETIAGVRQAALDFFALPAARKMEVYIGHSRNHRGYVPEGEEVSAGGTPDAKEAFDLSIDLPADDPDYLSGNPLLGPNQWPRDLPGFGENVAAYYEATFAVGHRLLRGFSEALGLPPDHLSQFVTKPPSQLRLIHYPYNAAASDRPGMGAHTDYEVFTLLLPTASGLEVMNGLGEWIDAPLMPGAFVINIGDMLEVWSNGTFAATSHRVRRVTQERYSFPLFFACDYGTSVEPLAPFVSQERPAAYPPIQAGEHLFAQTAQTFQYLKRRIASGEISLPEQSVALSSFGQAARHTPSSSSRPT